jgi:bifunctional DNA-binding transcriptional regulator/antitoxin component of YhaV-PrlF toxin-antitoxin module
VVIPAAMRKRYGLDEGATIMVEARPEGVLIRPAAVVPIEIYTPERRAEFILSTALDAEEYAEAVAEVRTMGLDPDRIPHYRPPGA